MAYISKEEAKEVRKALKDEFGGKLKFSVRVHNHSQLTVAIVSGDVDFSEYWADKVETDYDFGYVTIHHMHIKNGTYGKHTKLFEKINEIIKAAPAKAVNGREWYDNSDSMTDYFDTAFYYDIQIGKWNTPYKFIEA